MAIVREDFPLPDVHEARTAPFFEAASRGELVIPRCDACGVWRWYPAATCGVCDGRAFSWTPVSGRGRLYSWAVVRRAFLPAFADRVPFVSALVALDEDPAVRLVSYVVDCDPASLVADQPLEVVYRPLSFSTVPGMSVVVPMFVPA